MPPFGTLARNPFSDTQLKSLVKDDLYWNSADPDFKAFRKMADRAFVNAFPGEREFDATGREVKAGTTVAEPSLFKIDPMNITAPVGKDASNREGDVRKASNAFKILGLLGKDQSGDKETAQGELTSAIRGFQNMFGLKTDGLMNPGGETAKTLNKTFASAAPVKEEDARKDVGEKNGPQGSVLAERRKRKAERFRLRSPNAEIVNEFEKTPEDMRRRHENMVRVGRFAGFEKAADNLEHFLKGKGETKVLSREDARHRDFVRQGEDQNRKNFEESFISPGKKVKYFEALKALKDGERVDLREGQIRTGFKAKDHLLRLDIDEALATGKSDITSKLGGLTATRRGDTIHLDGVVEHRWDDRYDFHKGGSGAEDALELEKSGKAKAYWNRSGWKQRMTGTIKIRDGKLPAPQLTWEDTDESREHYKPAP